MYQQAVALNKPYRPDERCGANLAGRVHQLPLVNYITMKGDYYARKKASDELNRDYWRRC